MDDDSAIRNSQDIREKLRNQKKQHSRQWAHGYKNPNVCEHDFHYEYTPLSPTRVAHYTNTSQCPENDTRFMAVTVIFDACAEIRNECEECCLLDKCAKIHSAISEKGSDRPITKSEASEFVAKFLKMLMGDSSK